MNLFHRNRIDKDHPMPPPKTTPPTPKRAKINPAAYTYTEPSVIVTSDELELILAYRKCSKRDRVEIKQECVESAVHAEMCYRNDLARAHYMEGIES